MCLFIISEYRKISTLLVHLCQNVCVVGPRREECVRLCMGIWWDENVVCGVLVVCVVQCRVPACICRYKLKKAGLDLAKEMGLSLHEGCCVAHEDWKFMCSAVGYMK